MGVVHLEHIVFGELHQIAVAGGAPLAEDILQARGSKEILLAQAQFAAVLAAVVGVEHHRDVLGLVLRLHRLAITAGAEFVEVEFVGGGGLPQAQGVDRAIAVAGDRHVVGNGEHVGGVDPARARDAGGVAEMLDAPAKVHAAGELGTLDFPRVAGAQPVVGLLLLITVLDALAEHAVFVANAITHDRQLKGGAAVHETGGQAAEAAVAQAGVGLLLDDLFQRVAEALQRFARRRVKTEIEDMVTQCAADEEFERQVVGATPARLVARGVGVHPVGHDAVAQGPGERMVGIQRRGAVRTAQMVILVTLEITAQRLGVGGQRLQRKRAGGKCADLFGFLGGHDNPGKYQVA